MPEDLAVVGFDGTKESAFCWPPLTVVAQPIAEMARTAVRLVLDPGRPESCRKRVRRRARDPPILRVLTG